MENQFEREVKKHVEILSAWAVENGFIKPDQEIAFAFRIKKRWPKVTIKRWKLTDAEWETILSLPWTSFQRAVLQIHKDAEGKIPKSTGIQGHFYGRNICERGSPPSDATYILMNRMFNHAKLPFRFQWRCDRRSNSNKMSIAVCAFVP